VIANFQFYIDKRNTRRIQAGSSGFACPKVERQLKR